MLFWLIIVLPITIAVWVLVKLFRPKSKLDFEDLSVRVGLVIIGLWLAALFGAMAIAVGIQISRHLWILLILVPISIVATLLDHSATRTRRRQRLGE
jgi:hypothetical protein